MSQMRVGSNVEEMEFEIPDPKLEDGGDWTGGLLLIDVILINVALNFIGEFVNFNPGYQMYYPMCPISDGGS